MTAGPEPDARGLDERLNEAFRAGLDLPADVDVMTLALGQHQRWDSLGHMALIAALEQEFGISLSGDDVLDIRDYQSAAEVVRAHMPPPARP